MTTLSTGAWYRTLFAKTAQIHMLNAHQTRLDRNCDICGTLMHVFAFAQTMTDEELESVIAQG